MKSILFDLDGTLGNTLPLCVAAFREALEPMASRRLEEAEITATFGPSEEGTIAALLPDRHDEGLERYMQCYERLHSGWPEPFEGIREILSYLKEKRIFVGLVTGKGERSTQITLETFGMADYFEVVKTGAPTGPVKDRRIDEIIADYSLERAGVLYVGDSPGDIEACKQCDVKIAAAAWAPTTDVDRLREMDPDLLFTSISEFYRFLHEQLHSDDPDPNDR